MLLLLRPGIIRPTAGYKNLTTYGMYKSYLKIAWRDLAGNRIFSLIKISGLCIGLTVCMLILLYTKDELTFDQFHEHKGELYRIIQTMQFGTNPEQTVGITTPLFGEAFSREIPEVKQFVRINGASVTVKKDDDIFTENVLLVDSNFLSVFTFPLRAGNKNTSLKDPTGLVLSEDMAKKYFGTTDVIGETIQLKFDTKFEDFIVRAVSQNSPQNSSLKADILLPAKFSSGDYSSKDWLGGSLNTFLLLSPKADIKAVEAKMQALFDKNTLEFRVKMEKEQGMKATNKLTLQALTDIHLSKNAGPFNGMTGGSNPLYSYILTCIAIFVLVIACINFINLTVAQSLKRSKEIGIRKVIGGTRKQLIRQFLTESFLVSMIAFGGAILLTTLVLPFFNDLANKSLSLSYLSDGYLYAAYFLLLLVTSFVAGFYPSFMISAFQPVKALKNNQRSMGKNYLTKSLVVLQFSLTIFLIIGTIAINSQLEFLLHADLGYDTKNLVKIELPSTTASNKLPALFANELSPQSNILNVTARNGGRNTSGVTAEGKLIIIEYNKVDDKYLSVFKIPLIAGRNFSPNNPSDIPNSVIVNESFVKAAGWSVDNAVGRTINYVEDERRQVTIIGVIKDYHFASLKEKIIPELFAIRTNGDFRQVWVRIKPTDIPQTLTLLHNTFKKLVPYFPYSYQFMDDINAKNYQTEAKWKQIITIASVLFIFISCIGVLGLGALSIEQRTKEIGIRKVLGAAVSGIVMLISKEFIILISIAFIVAVPVGYYFMNKWLQDFAYRISLTWWMFALAGALVIAVALLTMSFQAIKAALMNPIKNLRSE